MPSYEVTIRHLLIAVHRASAVQSLESLTPLGATGWGVKCRDRSLHSTRVKGPVEVYFSHTGGGEGRPRWRISQRLPHLLTMLREVPGKREGRPFLYERGRAGTPAPSPLGEGWGEGGVSGCAYRCALRSVFTMLREVLGKSHDGSMVWWWRMGEITSQVNKKM